ncbi:oligopeptide/dipeptide ABC transporter ATP-binding protein [Dactylosporangium sp. CA-233914]|uniref:oligopeptide/dipeptide ABC transporter ATP-binding protein n=1 Tax=Dactylosporangium sp. CA-233914 TaxID=3239934 RepID=UPI003D925E1F
MREPQAPPSTAPLVTVTDVVRDFRLGERLFPGRSAAVNRAVDHVSFSVPAGSTFGLVGETGSGKTTLGRMIAGLESVTSGSIVVAGSDLARLRRGRLRAHRRGVQMVFQDPYASLNPRMTVGDLIREPLDIHHVGSRADRDRRVAVLLNMVHLNPRSASRYPQEFSGGQRQRIAIARGLALNPKLVVLDEPVAALDLSVRAQITNLLIELQDSTGITYVLISHDLLGVRHMADRVAVLYRGKLVELGPALEVYAHPQHPYTRQLIDAIPALGRHHTTGIVRDSQAASTPDAATETGCPFAPLCPNAQEVCRRESPALEEYPTMHNVACHFPLTPRDGDASNARPVSSSQDAR